MKKIKTIGMYYHRIYNGGVERVIGCLSKIFDERGYKLVIITDEPENELDYELPKDAKRVVLNSTWHVYDKDALAGVQKSL